MDEPKGYQLPYGYKGKLPNGEWMLFATQQEYMERLRDFQNEEVADGFDAA